MHNSTMKFFAALFLFAASSAACAHTGHGVSGWTAGLAHPFLGLDHLLAMLAVGLWAAQGGGRRMWLLPATFMATLAAGASLSMMGLPAQPSIEAGIATSVLILGLLIAVSLQLPIRQSVALTASFGLLHGYAHGLELPESAAPFAYATGFLAATVMLHLGGIAIGAATRQRYALLAKAAGLAIATSGVGLLTLS